MLCLIGKHDDAANAAIYAIDLFYAENEYYNYQTLECDENARWNTCDHYKQVVSANTRYIGCGLYLCDVMNIGDIDYFNVIGINFIS